MPFTPSKRQTIPLALGGAALFSLAHFSSPPQPPPSSPNPQSLTQTSLSPQLPSVPLPQHPSSPPPSTQILASQIGLKNPLPILVPDHSPLVEHDAGWRAAMWLLKRAAPRYKHLHENIDIERQASLIQYGLQQPPPLFINNVLYPTLESYMANQGFINQMTYVPKSQSNIAILSRSSEYIDQSQVQTQLNYKQQQQYGCWGLIGIWSIIFSTYKLATLNSFDFSKKSPTPIKKRNQDWFMRNLTLSYENRWKLSTYFTSAFTHFSLPHLLINSIALSVLSPNVGVVSPVALFSMFTSLSLISSLVSLPATTLLAKLLLSRGILRPGLLTPTVGASGGLTGLLAFFALNHCEQKVPLFFLPVETNMLHLLELMMGLDIMGVGLLCFGRNTGISHTGHLGGYLGGIGMFKFFKKKYEEQYPEQSYELYVNWVENLILPQKQNAPIGSSKQQFGTIIRKE